MRKAFLVLGAFAMVASSCQIAGSPSASSCSDNGYSNTEESSMTSSESPSSSESSSYQTDDEGFFVLEDGYFGCKTNPDDPKKVSKARIPPQEDNVPQFKNVRLYVAGKRVPIFSTKINVSQTFDGEAPDRIDSGVASFQLEGKATMILATNFRLNGKAVIRPVDKGVTPIIDEARRTIAFKIFSTGQYTIELSHYVVIHLWIDPIDEVPSESTITYYFGSGLHCHGNDPRIPKNGIIALHTNEKVYLAQGAVVQAGFSAIDSEGIEIFGDGLIDGSAFDRNVARGTKTIPLDFSYCQNLTLKDFGVTDPAGWCFNLYFCSDSLVQNCKVVSSRANGDGISIQSCKRMNVNGCFVRSWDDSIVVKNYLSWRDGSEGETESIHVSSCLIWTDLAQSMEIGYETIGQRMTDITFNDIVVLHNYHKAALSIHDANDADIKNVSFENITIEDAEEGRGNGNNLLLDFSVAYSPLWSDAHKKTALGSIDGVEVTNVKVIQAKAGLMISIKGSIDTREAYNGGEHLIKNVSICDFSVNGVMIDAGSDSVTIEHAKDITIAKGKETATGASLPDTDVSEYGTNIETID
jgi:hypothetical protein